MCVRQKGDAMFSSADIIDLAIQIEKNGEKVYRDALEGVQNQSVASILRWLADEEVEHAKWFSDLKQAVRKVPIDPRLEDMGRVILQGILGEESFSLKEADLQNLGSIDKLINLAIEFERDTVLFFQMFESFLEDRESIEHLNKIIEEERRHIQVLEEYLGGGPAEADRSKRRAV
jgi:rubrerythrin